MCFCDCLPSAAGGAGAGCPRCDAYQASLESGNPLVPVPLRLSSRPAARARRGPGRGAQGAFANQKNHRAQNDLGRSPPKAQHRPLGLLQTRPTRQKRSRTSLRDLSGRRSCTEEAQVALARRRRRRKLGLAPGRLATHGVSSQYGIIDSDAILVCEEPSLTSFVASNRPSFRIRRVRPRRCVPVQFT